MPWTSHSKVNDRRGFKTTDDLTALLRAAEERIRELEAKVRHHEDRADRAERWVYKIWVEIEQKFFWRRCGSLLRATCYRGRAAIII